MGVHAAVASTRNEQQPLLQSYTPPHPSATASDIYQSYPSYAQAVKDGDKQNGKSNGAGPSRVTLDTIRRESYGTASEGSTTGGSWKGQEPEDVERGREVDMYDPDEPFEPVVNVTWKYMSRLYLLVPVVSLIWFGLLVLLVTFAWQVLKPYQQHILIRSRPPSEKERRAGQHYPHPFLFNPFLVGIFASCTVQTLRVPIYVIVSWFGMSITSVESRVVHTILHELLRLSSLPLSPASPTSGFHSSYYLGLGWGIAEVAWGTVQGWEQLALYQEVMMPSASSAKDGIWLESSEEGEEEGVKRDGMLSSVEERDEDENSLNEDEESDTSSEDDVLDETELGKKVEILERMRERRELEEVIGVAFPAIPFALHLLWRLDTLLLNLGLTLILSSFYFNSTPIYHHSLSPSPNTLSALGDHPMVPEREPSRWLWLAWAAVVLVHVVVNLVWRGVAKFGIGAVTWGALIVALGSVFAGLGFWGGLV
ncbi:hypothetical protein I350_07265 [Cryptococcus amylolentus CBS 6273]|uniref:Uncharacterized protein n=1 Tax=Cryptococcus amylolentus CBS 6273 TaxID=1296118 RepID=A0A1E3JE02_9TREE|nr:hypothetical protein I350_07265 [Cryptococcus amylolentus CBS 6273]